MASTQPIPASELEDPFESSLGKGTRKNSSPSKTGGLREVDYT
jgi:hypothetical protein